MTYISEQENLPEKNELEIDKAVKDKLGNFLKKNQGSAFTIRAISNRLEQILNDPDELDYAKKNLQEILDRMSLLGIIDIAKDNEETHYLIKKVEKKLFWEQKVRLEKELEEKLSNFLNENRGIAFTLRDLTNKLEEIIKAPDELDYAKENLQVFLNKMKINEKIDTILSNEEIYYIFKKSEKIIQEKSEEIFQEKTFEVKNTNLRPPRTTLARSIIHSRTEATKVTLAIGALLGLLTMVYTIRLLIEILTVLGFIFIILSILGEIVVASKQTKEDIKYDRPTYGLAALVFDIIGLILLNRFGFDYGFYYSGSSTFLIAICLFIIAILCGMGGLYGSKDSRPYAAIVGLFFGITFFTMNLLPLIYYLVSFI